MSSFRVFISSTFKNFQFERDYLAKNLYEPLNVFCGQKGYAFHGIDLRWGISNEASLDNKTMLFCFEEIRKCRQTHIVPNFLVMVGDYYGWRPLPFYIKEREKQLLWEYLDVKDKELFEQCYSLDENQIEHTYVLRGREGLFKDEEIWACVENHLHKALEKAASICLPESGKEKFIFSATHQEIIEGLLKDNIIKDYTFVFFKEEGDIYNSTDDYIKARMLKDELIKVLQPEQYGIYRTEQEFVEVAQKAQGFIKSAIEQQINALAGSNKNNETFEALKENYISNVVFEDGLKKAINDAEGKIIVVTSDIYGGKTSLFVKLSEELQNSFFWSANSDSNHTSVIQLCRFLMQKSSKEKSCPLIDYNNAIYYLEKTLNLYADIFVGLNKKDSKERLVFLIDGLDELWDYKKIKEDFFHITLPNQITLVISMSRQPNAINAKDLFTIPVLGKNDKEKLFFSILTKAGRAVTLEQYQILKPQIEKGEPYFIRLLANRVLMLRSYEKLNYENLDLETMLHWEFDKLSSPIMYGEIIISRILAYLSFAEFGISEEELFDLLGRDMAVINFLKASSNWVFDESLGIPKVILYRIFADLKGYILEQNESGDIIYKLASKSLVNIIRQYIGKENIIKFYKFFVEYYNNRPIYINKRRDVNERLARLLISMARFDVEQKKIIVQHPELCDACIKIGEINFLVNAFKELSISGGVLYDALFNNITQLISCKDMFIPYFISEGGDLKGEYYFMFDITRKIFESAIPWNNEDIKFAYDLSDDLYIIAFGNSIVKISKNNKCIIEQLHFSASILDCKVSYDKQTMLVVCMSPYISRAEMKIYAVSIKNFCIEYLHRIEDYSELDYVNESISIITMHDNEFLIMISVWRGDENLKLRGRQEYPVYLVRKAGINKIFSSYSAIGCSLINIDAEYILVKEGLRKLKVYNLNGELLCSKKIYHNLGMDLRNANVAQDGCTYCVVADSGLFSVAFKKSKLIVKKIVNIFNYNFLSVECVIFLLKDCFVIRLEGKHHAEVYNYAGVFLGTIKNNGGMILKKSEDKIIYVMNGGQIMYTKIDSTYTCDLTKVHYSLRDCYRMLFGSLKRIKLFNAFYSSTNNQEVKLVSSNEKYVAKLTKYGLCILDRNVEIFNYSYKSQDILSRKIKFVTSDTLVWLMSTNKIMVINVENKTNKIIYRSANKHHNVSVGFYGNEIYIYGREIIKYTLLNNDYKKEKIKNTRLYDDQIELIKLEKSGYVRFLFDINIPSRLQFVCDEKDGHLIYLDLQNAVRLENNKLLFYEHDNCDQLKISYDVNCLFDQGRSRAYKVGDELYYYIANIRLIVIYNIKTKQRLEYIVNDNVCDVVFNDHTISLLYSDDSIGEIKIAIS